MVTGYQRQHRKSINYIASEGGDSQTTDQYTRIIDHACNVGAINEQFSKACELAAISGLVMLQPYLDYTGDDPAQGTLKAKIWNIMHFSSIHTRATPGFQMHNSSGVKNIF